MQLARKALIASSLLALALTGPVTAEEPTAGGSPGARPIAVTPFGLPERAIVMTIKTPSDALGIFGIAVEVKRGLAAAKELAAELETGGLDCRTCLPAQLERALKSVGYEVTMLAGTRSGGDNFKFLAHPPAAPGGAALLDVFVDYLGYSADSTHDPYRPLVQLHARLLEPKSGKTALETQVNYGRFTAKDVVALVPDAKYSFADRPAMQAAPLAVTEGLRSAIDAAIAELARQLKPQPG